MDWKPVSELPPNSQPTAENPASHALCWCESGRSIKGIYYDNQWHLDWDGSFDNDDEVPTHWCLVTPPSDGPGESKDVAAVLAEALRETKELLENTRPPSGYSAASQWVTAKNNAVRIADKALDSWEAGK